LVVVVIFLFLKKKMNMIETVSNPGASLELCEFQKFRNLIITSGFTSGLVISDENPPTGRQFDNRRGRDEKSRWHMRGGPAGCRNRRPRGAIELFPGLASQLLAKGDPVFY